MSTKTGSALASATTSAVAAKVKLGTKTASPGADAGGHQRQQQRVGAVGAADRMLDADIGGELLLELGDLRPVDIFAGLDDALDRGFQPVAKPLALRAKIDKLHQCPQSQSRRISLR